MKLYYTTTILRPLIYKCNQMTWHFALDNKSVTLKKYLPPLLLHYLFLKKMLLLPTNSIREKPFCVFFVCFLFFDVNGFLHSAVKVVMRKCLGINTLTWKESKCSIAHIHTHIIITARTRQYAHTHIHTRDGGVNLRTTVGERLCLLRTIIKLM